jgi:hypothetical protein
VVDFLEVPGDADGSIEMRFDGGNRRGDLGYGLRGLRRLRCTGGRVNRNEQVIPLLVDWGPLVRKSVYQMPTVRLRFHRGGRFSLWE